MNLWQLIIMLMAVVLSNGCKAMESAATPSRDQSEHKKTDQPVALAAHNFNQKLLKALNQFDTEFLSIKISHQSIAEQLGDFEPRLFGTELETLQAASEVKQQLLFNLFSISENSTWHYMYSKGFTKRKMASYYRIGNEDGYSYVTFWIDPLTNQIQDFHSLSFEFSTVRFLTAFTQMFMKYSNQAHQKQLARLNEAAQSNTPGELLNAYLALEQDIRLDPALNDFVLRLLSQTAAADSASLMSAMAENQANLNKTSLLFEAHYIKQEDFQRAIDIINRLPNFARKDVKMLSELAILHAYNQDFELAKDFGNQAMESAPLDEEACFVMIQVSLLAKDYALTTKLLDTLISRFDYVISYDTMTEFDEADLFLSSSAFQSWATKMASS